jgi:hypothetical protein
MTELAGSASMRRRVATRCRTKSGSCIISWSRVKPFAQMIFPSILIAVIYSFFSASCVAQEESRRREPSDSSDTPTQPEQSETPDELKTMPGKQEKRSPRGAFVAAPLPISSPAIGTGVIPVAAYIFPFSRKDTTSSPSVVGGGGLITGNGSRGIALACQLYVDENRYRITAAYARGNINYNVYGSGTAEEDKLPLKQTGHILLGEFLRQVGWKFYVGPRLITGQSLITLRSSHESDVPIPPDLGIHTTLTALGFTVFRDTVPNRFYPTSGDSFKFMGDFYAEALGSKYSFQSYTAAFDKYWSLDKKQVLAYNVYFCGTEGTPPFYGNCIYGAKNELRGYTAGKYFTSYMAATQLEYRLVLPKRFGLVAFGGVGGVIPGKNQLYGSQQRFLPSVGGGARFLLSKQYHVNLRVDYGVGRDGQTVGMSVGEAF